jgi:hypothetical protein
MMASNAEAFTINQIKRWSQRDQESYMMGLMDGTPITVMELCSFGETYLQDIEVLKKYIANNPAEWGLQVATIYLRAMAQAYHCGDSQNKPKKVIAINPNTGLRW